MDPCCSAGRFLMTILPKVLWKSPVVLGAPHLTDSNLGEACHQVAPGNSVWCALDAARKLYHFPPATVLRTEEGLSHHLWGQLSCQLLWLASGNSERMKLCDLEWSGVEGEEACVSSGDRMGDMLLTQLSVAILLPSLCLREAVVWRQNQTALATVPKRHLQKCQLHGSQDCAVFKKEI